MGDTKYIARVVATYWFVSISMVYLNKVLMSSEAVSIGPSIHYLVPVCCHGIDLLDCRKNFSIPSER